jgi:hypothetical protein
LQKQAKHYTPPPTKGNQGGGNRPTQVGQRGGTPVIPNQGNVPIQPPAAGSGAAEVQGNVLDQSGEIESGGAVSERIYFGPVPAGVVWKVENIVVIATTALAIPGTFNVVSGLNSIPDASSQRDFTSDARHAVSDRNSPIPARTGSYFCMEFKGTLAGDVLTCNITGTVERYD